MKEFVIFKSTIKTLVILLTMTTVFVITIVAVQLFGSAFLPSLLISVFNILLIIMAVVIYYKLLSKSKNKIIINEEFLIHKNKQTEEQIKITFISRIEYDHIGFLYCKLIVNYLNDSKYEFLVNKYMIKRLEKELNIEVININNKGQNKTSFKNTFKDNKEIILGAITGLILTVVSIIMYVNYQNRICLTVLLSVVCLIHAGYQGYSFYIKDKSFDRISKLVLTILFLVLFVAIIFTLITVYSMASLKKPFTVDYVFYALFVTPSFLIIIILLCLLLMGLSYSS